MKVVIVDDEWYGLDLTYRLLTQVRIDLDVVAFFQDPREALERIPHLEPDLIILDIEMPYLNGFEMYERLKTMSAQFLMISAHGEAYRRQEGIDHRIRIMSKPFSKADMSTLLDSYQFNQKP
jgi:YesN/AraC family two-component response regulator